MAHLQDAWPLGLEFLLELRVALLCWDEDGERDQVETAADGFVDIAQAWLVIAGDEQLELRAVGEEVLAHEAGADRVAAGECLDAGFRPVTAFLGFLGRHQPGAAQCGEVGGVPIVLRGGEGLHAGDRRVAAQQAGESVEEHALAVASGAVEEEQRMLFGDAGERIAG